MARSSPLNAPSLLDLVGSADAVASAFERVQANQGCAGADGVTIVAFARRLDSNLATLARQLRDQSYRPLPLLRALVERKDGDARPLCIPTVRDRIAQAAALQVLGPLFESAAEPCSFGYRPGRGVRDAVRLIENYRDAGYSWVFEADIDAYFDNVDHELLLARLKPLVVDMRVVKLITRWVRAFVWDGSQIYRLKRGIPQGSVISPALANLFLDHLDETLLAAGQKLVRYADDFIVLCKDQPGAERAARLTDEVMDSLHLELDDAAITRFDAGFKFLGLTFARSLVLQPFAAPPTRRGVRFMPPPLNPDQLRRWRPS